MGEILRASVNRGSKSVELKDFMKSKVEYKPLDAWDAQTGEILIKELWTLRKLMLDHQARIEPWLGRCPLVGTAQDRGLD